MKNSLRYRTLSLGFAVLLPALNAADDPKPEVKKEKNELRVLAAPDHGAPRAGGQIHPRVFTWTGEGGEKETVTFLGVVTSPVSPTLTAQLNLASGSGLVVNQVENDSPAANILKEHDILVKLDDQQLVDQRQLSVLIRQHKEGDEVTLAYIRGGKPATARVKLAKHEVRKISGLFTEPLLPGVAGAGAGAMVLGSGANRFEVAVPAPGSFENREDMDRVLSLIESHGGQTMRMRIDHADGPGIRAMSINPANSNLVYSDDDGSLELTVKDDRKSLVAKNKKGEQLFAGPVNTPDERKALPGDVRKRLEKLEGMQDITFRTDGDFKGAETRLLRPTPRGISLPPIPAVPAAPVRPPLFF